MVSEELRPEERRKIRNVKDLAARRGSTRAAALAAARELLDWAEANSPPNDPYLSNLASIVQEELERSKLKREAANVDLDLIVLGMEERLMGENHQNILKAKFCLAYDLYYLKEYPDRFKKSAELLSQNIKILQGMINGPKSSLALDCHTWLVHAYLKMEQYDVALQESRHTVALWQEVLQQKPKLSPKGSKDCKRAILAKYDLGRVLQKIGTIESLREAEVIHLENLDAWTGIPNPKTKEVKLTSVALKATREALATLSGGQSVAHAGHTSLGATGSGSAIITKQEGHPSVKVEEQSGHVGMGKRGQSPQTDEPSQGILSPDPELPEHGIADLLKGAPILKDHGATAVPEANSAKLTRTKTPVPPEMPPILNPLQAMHTDTPKDPQVLDNLPLISAEKLIVPRILDHLQVISVSAPSSPNVPAIKTPVPSKMHHISIGQELPITGASNDPTVDLSQTLARPKSAQDLRGVVGSQKTLPTITPHGLSKEEGDIPKKEIPKGVESEESTPPSPVKNEIPTWARGKTFSGLTEKSRMADAWFKRIEEMNRVLVKKKRTPPYERVKIAILDTGIRDDSPYWSKITAYKDFVLKENKKGVDKTGHGTNGVHLVFKCIADAEIYVGRVFDHGDADHDTANLMTEAITWATEKKVDIISMSFGFENPDPKMRMALEKAKSSNILLFAAASNEGNLGGVAFPATLWEERIVMCIYSATGGGKGSEFNPSPSALAPQSFAFLGEEVNVGVQASKVVRDSGTSLATSVATGIAGRILDFSRHEELPFHIPGVRKRCCDKLKTLTGMAAVFGEMAREARDGRYQCVQPWKLTARLEGMESADRNLIYFRMVNTVLGRG